MNGSKAKAMRKYVAERFPFLSAPPLYQHHPNNPYQCVLATQCQRSMYKLIKRNYKRARSLGHTAWVEYQQTQTENSV